MNFNLDPQISKSVLNSLVLTLLIVFIRVLIVRGIRNSKISLDYKRKWMLLTKTYSSIIIAVSLVVVWGQELQNFALSLVAIAAAVVIATKEFIMCGMGGILRIVSRPFELRDRIEIDEFRGDVVSINLLSTTLLEIGPEDIGHQYTGRSIVLPNSIFLSNSVINETFTHRYVLHVFKLPFKHDQFWESKHGYLLESCVEVTKEYIDQAEKFLKQMGDKEGLESPSVDPVSWVHFEDTETVVIYVRVPAPASQKGRIQQRIIRHFLNKLKEKNISHP